MKRTNDPSYQQKLFLVHLLKNRGYTAADLANPQVDNIFDKEWNELVEKVRRVKTSDFPRRRRRNQINNQ